MRRCYLKALFLVTISVLLFSFAIQKQMARSYAADLNQGTEAGEYAHKVDSDGDGVPDDLDVCPDTPQGVKVGDLGCPPDTDGDGVDDYLDQCPDTPMTAKVDAKGCPVEVDMGPSTHFVCCREVFDDGQLVEFDVDRDGVPDFKDECLGTPKGAKVDEKGCWVLGEIYFDTGKWDIKASDFLILDEVGAVLKKNPNLKMEIQGHTDNRVSAADSQILSKKRANSVTEYLVNQGIARDRLSSVGLGSSEPVAPDTAPEGQAKSRRVNLMPTR
ncbi:MAG: OmpA family protein [Desulfatiglandales bacterium]